MKKSVLISIFTLLSLQLYSQETKCECYSKSGVTEKTGIGGWTSIIGYNSEGEQLQYHFYAAYFPPQELCIPRDNIWWQEVEAAILKAIKSHPIYLSSQIALKTDDPDATPQVNNLSGQAFITEQEVNRIKKLPGTIVSVESYLQENFASKLSLCSDSVSEKASKIQKEKIHKKDSPSQKKEKVISPKDKQFSDAQNFIDNQNIAQERQDKLNKKLVNQVATIFDGWTKQRDFDNRINSLTQVNSNSINSIIAEVKQKSRAIDNQYDQQGIDTRNNISKAGQKYESQAKNENQANVSKSITGLAQILGQQSNEKQRRDSQQKLSQQQEKAINTLVKNFEGKIQPRKESYIQLAALSVYPIEEDYYLELYNYNDCLYDNAYSILEGSNNCTTPISKKPPKKSNISGQDYYKAYERKKSSGIERIKIEAETFLELAIDAEPSNANYIYEKTLINDLDVYENAALLKKANSLDRSNKKIDEAYKRAIRVLEEFVEAERLSILKYAKENENFSWDKHSGLKSYAINNKTVFIDKKGNIIFELEKNYSLINGASASNVFGLIKNNEFNNGLIQVTKGIKENKKYGYLNTKGNPEIPIIFEQTVEFSEGLGHKYISEKTENSIYSIAASKAGSVYSKHHSIYVNKKNEIVINGKDKFCAGQPFMNGVAVVYNLDRKNGFFINKKGDNAFNLTFKNAYSFENREYTLIRNERDWFTINQNGERISDDTFKEVKVFTDGRPTIVRLSRKKYAKLDNQGMVIPEE